MLKLGSSARLGVGSKTRRLSTAVLFEMRIVVGIGPPAGVVREYRCHPDSIFASSRASTREPEGVVAGSNSSVHLAGSSFSPWLAAVAANSRTGNKHALLIDYIMPI